MEIKEIIQELKFIYKQKRYEYLPILINRLELEENIKEIKELQQKHDLL